LIECVLGLVNAGCIHEGKLRGASIHDAQNLAACGLGCLADRRELFPDQGVEQGGLARIGNANDGDGSEMPCFSHDGPPGVILG